MNRIMLIGRISKDIELRTTGSGKDVANFSIAVNNPYKKDEQGNTQADFFDCIVWETQAVNLQKYQEKGDLIAIEGRLANQKWQDENGNNHYKNIVVCESIEYLAKCKSSQTGQQTGKEPIPPAPVMQEDPFKDFGEEITLSDDDLPF